MKIEILLEYYSEDKDCVDSMNELSNLKEILLMIIFPISDLDSINSDEKSLKSSLSSINSNGGCPEILDSSNSESLNEVLKDSSSVLRDLQILIDNAQDFEFN